jgi:hypothetical protein
MRVMVRVLFSVGVLRFYQGSLRNRSISQSISDSVAIGKSDWLMATGYTPVSAWSSQKRKLFVVIPLYIGTIGAFIYLMFALKYQINLYYYFYDMDDSLEMQCLVTGKDLIRKPCASVPLFEETCSECSCYSGEYLISYQDDDDSKVDASIITKAFVPQLKKKVKKIYENSSLHPFLLVHFLWFRLDLRIHAIAPKKIRKEFFGTS